MRFAVVGRPGAVRDEIADGLRRAFGSHAVESVVDDDHRGIARLASLMVHADAVVDVDVPYEDREAEHRRQWERRRDAAPVLEWLRRRQVAVATVTGPVDDASLAERVLAALDRERVA